MSRRRRRAAGTIAALALIASCTSCTIATDSPAENPCAPESSPGGVSLPRGDLQGWKQIFSDDFDDCDLGSDWGTYSGQPGGNPNSTWDASMVQVDGGLLNLNSHRTDSGWITGGVSNYPVTQQYGRWEIRMRADNSDDISYHMLLWPQNEKWPPEIDFAESVSGTRDEMSAFLHWVDDKGTNDKKGVSTGGDFSEWHTVGVEWGPGIVRYLLDGKVWAEAHSETMVPDVPMWLGLQAEAGACERREDWGMTPCSDFSEQRPDNVAVQVDWVTVYAADFDELEKMQKSGYYDPSPDAIQFTD
ncbi:glycoside hydrolase family 16 protein [Rhodococcus globerulus]|uniref:glycoside hydrolase family 16 protein n=1 Tax=Rhodococcus globerulus TaxID=33008 RepID=UPI001C55EAC9|nr:glycoside hydrolase family 16 protein [Rhodococcus globerulus]QXW04844.1 glycoside hydrolase family 16 protein [Rhodococcus globerulus]